MALYSPLCHGEGSLPAWARAVTPWVAVAVAVAAGEHDSKVTALLPRCKPALQKRYQYLVHSSLDFYGCLSWTAMLHLCSFHIRNILDTIAFIYLFVFLSHPFSGSIALVWWEEIVVFILQTILMSECQKNCQSKPLDPDKQGRGADRKILNCLALVHRNSGCPARKLPSFLWPGALLSTPWAKAVTFPETGRYSANMLHTWPSWNPRLLGESKRPLLSRSHIGMPYESPRISGYFDQLRVCVCTCGYVIHMLCLIWRKNYGNVNFMCFIYIFI